MSAQITNTNGSIEGLDFDTRRILNPTTGRMDTFPVERLSSDIQSNPSGITGASAITNIVSISEEDYDNIVTPDPATLYVIA
jgi:hypothetical protein